MIGIETGFEYLSGERSYSLSNYTKGALTHHPGGEVVFPLEIVRSPRGMRLLRQPDGQCHSSEELMSLSTQLVCGMYRKEYCRL